MKDKIIAKLGEIENEINAEYERAKRDETRLTALSILVSSFSSTLNNGRSYLNSSCEEENTQLRHLTKQFNAKNTAFQNKLKELQDFFDHNRMLTQEESQTEAAQEYNVFSGNNDEFMAQSTRRVSNYIDTAIDSLEALKKQRKYLEKIRDKISDGLISLGVSESMVKNISNRYLNDYRCFLAGAAGVIGLFVILKYI